MIQSPSELAMQSLLQVLLLALLILFAGKCQNLHFGFLCIIYSMVPDHQISNLQGMRGSNWKQLCTVWCSEFNTLCKDPGDWDLRQCFGPVWSDRGYNHVSSSNMANESLSPTIWESVNYFRRNPSKCHNMCSTVIYSFFFCTFLVNHVWRCLMHLIVEILFLL